MLRRFASLCLILLVPVLAAAEMHVSGNQSGTWLRAYEPYYIEGDVTVPSGSTLEIEAGCRVIFNGEHRLAIYGTLRASGNDADRIEFTVASPTDDGCEIWLDAAQADTTVFEFCDITGFSGSYGLYGRPSSKLRLSDCRIFANAMYNNPAVGMLSGHLVVERCEFSDNSSTYASNAGALQISDSGRITDCSFTGNRGDRGAVQASGDIVVSSCTFVDNESTDDGGGLYLLGGTPSIENCFFEGCTASSFGGGIYVRGTVEGARIVDCTIRNCSAADGGGISAWGDALVSDCLIESNHADDTGGGVHGGSSLQLQTSLLAGNSSANDGGGVYFYSAGTMTQVTVSGNDAVDTGGAIYSYAGATVNSCIFWGNSAAISPEIHGSVDASYSDIWGMLPPGAGNISADPLFVDAAGGDFNLLEDSPCIDAGDPDLADDPDATRADMGAFFYDRRGTIIVSPTPSGLPFPWYLEGPSGPVSGEGYTELPDMLDGTYSLTWQAYPGWVPEVAGPITGILPAQGELEIAGHYFAIPVAAFAPGDTAVTTPAVVQFENLSAGDVTSWNWEFGDGESSAVEDPLHGYPGVGVYTVSLTVAGPAGSDVATSEITVVDEAVAAFAASDTTGVAPLVVGFTNESSGTIDEVSWDFGDGATSTAWDPQHMFVLPGDHVVELTVGNAAGTDTASLTIHVINPVGIADGGGAVPERFEVVGNFPNPFNPRTVIRFGTAARAAVIVDVYGLDGRRVIRLVDELLDPGWHDVVWSGCDQDGARVASGAYLCRVQAGDEAMTQRVMLAK